MTLSSRWLPAVVAAIVLLTGCSSMPNAAEQSQQDPMPRTTTAPAPSDVQATPDRPLPHPLDPARGYEEAVDNGTRTADGRPGEDYWIQEVDYDLDATVQPDEKRVDATASITYTNNSPDTLNQVLVELAQNLHKAGVERNIPSEVTGGVTVERITVDGTEASQTQRPGPPRPNPRRPQQQRPAYAVQNTSLVIVPNAPLSPSASVDVTIEYSFTIPQRGAAGRMGYNGDDLIFVAYWYPQVSVYDDVTGWMSDPFLGLAEFYADFGDYDVSITAPSDWLVQSTGSLENPEAVLNDEGLQRYRTAISSDSPTKIAEPGDRVTQTGDPLTWNYRAEKVRDVAFSLTKGHWEAARAPVGDVDGDGATDSTEVHTYWRSSAPKWAKVTEYQQHAITYFSEYTGIPYPWPHMSAVEGGGIIGGGMEFPMMTIMGDYNNNSARMLYAVTAHELAHMWVPMLVNTNERRYSWMDEGVTSFNENMARADYFDDSEAIASDRADYVEFVNNGGDAPIMRWSNYHYSRQDFGVASYRKPATLYPALRAVLGEETFNEAYRTFLDEWMYKHPYPTDFFNTFERVSGQDLDWFWASYYHETWTLDHAIGEVTARGDRLEVTVEDHGRAFMPVHLTVTLNDGTTIDRKIPVDVWLRGRTSATTTLNLDASRVAKVEIDAENHFPDVDRSNNTWTAAD
jgi:hypothetical protein